MLEARLPNCPVVNDILQREARIDGELVYPVHEVRREFADEMVYCILRFVLAFSFQIPWKKLKKTHLMLH